MLKNSLYKKKEKKRIILILSLVAILIFIIGIAIGYYSRGADQIDKIEKYLEDNYVCYEKKPIFKEIINNNATNYSFIHNLN